MVGRGSYIIIFSILHFKATTHTQIYIICVTELYYKLINFNFGIIIYISLELEYIYNHIESYEY